MLHHADPAVVGLVGEFRLALVDVGKRQLLVFVGFVVEHRTGVGRRRAPAPDAGRLAVAGELKIGDRRDRRGAGVGHCIAHVDQVAAAMEGQRLRHLGAIRRRGDELEVKLVRAGWRARAAREAPATACGGWACPSPINPLSARKRAVLVPLQQHVGLVGVVGVAMRGKRNFGDHATQGIDLGGVAVGLDRR